MMDPKVIQAAHEQFISILKSGLNPLTLERRGTHLDAHERFLRSVMFHVAHPITYVLSAPALLAQAMPGHPDLLLCVSSDEFGRMFAPPFSNFLMSCFELFLEENFLEKYQKPDGTTYSTADDWRADAVAFGSRHASKLELNDNKAAKWVANFKFQRAPDFETLYRIALGIDVVALPEYTTVRLLWLKRHLFTHKAGIIDRKFMSDWNSLCEPANRLAPSSIGQLAHLELQWVVDALAELLKFAKALNT
ncbi:MAG: hypothetical protein R3B70_00180 [Polyangiaceae bacterium]